MVSRYFYDDNVTIDTNAQCFAAKVSHFLDTVLAVMLPYPTLPYMGNILRGETLTFAMTILSSYHNLGFSVEAALLTFLQEIVFLFLNFLRSAISWFSVYPPGRWRSLMGVLSPPVTVSLAQSKHNMLIDWIRLDLIGY